MAREIIITVTTTPTLLMYQNPLRKEYKLQNQDIQTIFLGVTSDVAATGTRTGRILGAGVLESGNETDDPATIHKEIYGVVAAGTANVWVYEA